MAWSVNEIKIPVFPFDWYACRLYGYASLPLSGQKVCCGTPAIDRAGGWNVG